MGNLFGSESDTTTTTKKGPFLVTIVGSEKCGKTCLIRTLNDELSKSPRSIPFDADYHDFKDCVPRVEEGKIVTSKGDEITLADSQDAEDYVRIVDMSMNKSDVVVILVSSKKAGFSSVTQDESRKRALDYVKRVDSTIPIIIVYSRVDLVGKDDTGGACFDDSRIVAKIKVSSKAKTGISELKEAIEKAIYSR